MHVHSRTDYNKEVIAQGIGNTLAGLIGVLPMTGMVIRSIANINAGADSKQSTIYQSLWLVGSLFLFTGLIELIPLASLAAILVHISIKLIDFKVR